MVTWKKMCALNVLLCWTGGSYEDCDAISEVRQGKKSAK